jgi:hypothetical protein
MVGWMCAFVTPSMPGITRFEATERDPTELLREANAPDAWRPPDAYVIAAATKVARPFDVELGIHVLLFSLRAHERGGFFRIPADDARALLALIALIPGVSGEPAVEAVAQRPDQSPSGRDPQAARSPPPAVVASGDATSAPSRGVGLRWHHQRRDVEAGDGPLLARDGGARGAKQFAKQFARARDAAHILEIIHGTPNPSLYEHVGDAPCTLYFDVDRKGNDEPRSVLRESLAWIVRFLALAGHAVDPATLLVLDGCRPGKASFHVLVPSLYLAGDAARGGLSRAIRARNALDASDVDPAPYGRHALLRTIWSSKLGTGAPLRPAEGFARRPDGEYLIGTVRADARPLELVGAAARSAKGDDTQGAAVVAAVRAAGDATSELHSVEGGRYYFRPSGRRACLLDPATVHESNNFLVVLADGAMQYVCLAARCRDARRRSLGAAPSPAAVVATDL